MSAAMSVDEESTENINIECRPMTVTDEYLNFMSETWLDAKTELDEATEKTEKEKMKAKVTGLRREFLELVAMNEKQPEFLKLGD